MSENKRYTDFRSDSGEAQPTRLGIVLGGLLVLLIAVLLAFEFHSRPALAPPAPTVATSQDNKITSAPKALPLPAFVSKAAPVPAPATIVHAAAPIAPEKLSPEQIVAELAAFGLNGSITPEQTARFKALLNELIQRGPASVPAIQALLAKNMDVRYGNISGGDQLGFSSLRASMIDSLRQIGGPEAQAALVATLQSTASPSELLQVASALNQQAPGQYRDQIIAAAQETLKMAAAGQLGTNAEVGPILHMLQAYGTPSTMADAAKNNPAEFAAAVQLANLPNGQGLPALAKMAQDTSSGSQLMATEMIAQLAGQNSDALNTLAQLVQDGKVQSGDWIHLAPLLGGDQYQLDPSGQKYSVVSSDMSSDQVSQRIMLIDTFMNYVPDGSGAYKALNQERSLLAAKAGGN